jgi:hypothetical protein
MKKILLIAAACLLAFNFSFGQRRGQTIKWFSLAAKAGVGNSLFINSKLMSDPNVNLNYFSLSQSYGGRFTFTYGDYVGFGTDVLYSTYTQDYSIKTDAESYDKTLSLQSLDIAPFFRYTAATGVYVELGVKISNVKSVSVSNSNNSLTFFDRDFGSYYETKFNSAMFGLGLAIFRTDRIDVNLGIRGSYSLTDVLPDRTFNIVADGVYVPDYIMDKTTNPLAVQAILEVNYYFAFWGDASCNRGRLSFFQ